MEQRKQRNIAIYVTVVRLIPGPSAKDSNLLHNGICPACDSRADRRVKPALSRTAQRGVFALWVIAGSLCRRLASIASKSFNICSRPAGRMNARTADYAGAWLQETDRLETARNRAEPAYHRVRDHDAGPHPQGRRYRRDPGCADRNSADPHRARRAGRGRRILHADVL